MKGESEQLGRGEARETRGPKRVFVEVGTHTSPVPAVGERGLGENDIYIGIEPDRDAAWMAKRIMEKRAQRPGETGKRFMVQGSGETLPLDDASADEMYFGNVLDDPKMNFETRRKLLREASRVLKEEGQLVIGETFPDPVPFEDVRKDCEGSPLVLEAVINHPEKAFADMHARYGGRDAEASPDAYYAMFRKRNDPRR